MFTPKSFKDCPTALEIIALLKSPSKEDIALIEKAYDFAKQAHEGQLRYSGEPYFCHLANVGYNLAAMKMLVLLANKIRASQRVSSTTKLTVYELTTRYQRVPFLDPLVFIDFRQPPLHTNFVCS